MSLCQDVQGGRNCWATAQWLVRVGSRTSDQQYSCGRHLDRTCRAMAEERHAQITLIKVAGR